MRMAKVDMLGTGTCQLELQIQRIVGSVSMRLVQERTLEGSWMWAYELSLHLAFQQNRQCHFGPLGLHN